MAKVKTTVWDGSPEDPDHPYYTCYSGDMSLQGWAKIRVFEFEFEDISREEKIAAVVRAIRAEQEKMVERHAKEFKHLQDRLANILALGNGS